MKKTINRLFEGISTQSLQMLTTTVSETLALEHSQPSRVFTTTDLWNIQRQGRVRTNRRFL